MKYIYSCKSQLQPLHIFKRYNAGKNERQRPSKTLKSYTRTYFIKKSVIS